MTLAGHNALITGGGSGIGLACARRLLGDGATVTLMGRTEDKLRKAAAELGEGVRVVPGDVTQEADVERAVAAADEGDGLRIVVASAGVGWAAPVATIPLEAWRNVIETNMTGTFLTLKHAAPRMRANGGGSFTAISSVGAQIPLRWLSPYAAAKAGVDHFVRTTADELGPFGIRVNSVLPGYVPTELNLETQSEDNEITRAFIANMPMGRVGTVEDVSNAVGFLAGPDATWITGVCLQVDGGHHLRAGNIYDSFVATEHGTDWMAP